jgi:hypothetical protein
MALMVWRVTPSFSARSSRRRADPVGDALGNRGLFNNRKFYSDQISCFEIKQGVKWYGKDWLL